MVEPDVAAGGNQDEDSRDQGREIELQNATMSTRVSGWPKGPMMIWNEFAPRVVSAMYECGCVPPAGLCHWVWARIAVGLVPRLCVTV
jgi:hypothetical protein